MTRVYVRLLLFGLSIFLLGGGSSCYAKEIESNFENRAYLWATQCRDEIVQQFEVLMASGQLREGQLFDTFYVPIPNTKPQKFHTQYDRHADEVIRPILDRFLAKDPRLIFVVLSDLNGYVPTHNTRFSQPMTGNPEVDLLQNRSKRIAIYRTGLNAAKSTEDYLLQQYTRDTGHKMMDLSVPIFIGRRHWGAVRIGFE